MKKKWSELKEGDVVEFTHSGQHEKTVGVVVRYAGDGITEFDGSPRKFLIDCGEYKTGVFGRTYKVLNTNKSPAHGNL